MALITIFKNEYDTVGVHKALIDYILFQKAYNPEGEVTGYEMSKIYGGNKIYFYFPDYGDASYMAWQMEQTLKMAGKDSGQRLLHFSLDFDSTGEESYIGYQEAAGIADMVSRGFFCDYQNIWAIHDNIVSHLHIHFIVNAVNLFKKEKLPRKNRFYLELKDYINLYCGITCPDVLFRGWDIEKNPAVVKAG